MKPELLAQLQKDAQRIVMKMSGGAPSYVDREDILSEVYVAMLQAVNRYNPEHNSGAKFRTYVQNRMRGAVLDYMRAIDPAGRTARSFIKKAEVRQDEMCQEENREVSLSEAAKDLGASQEQWEDKFARYHRAIQVSIHSPVFNSSDGQTIPLSDKLDNGEQLLEERVADSVDIQEKIPTLLSQLPERERKIVTMYYVEEMTLKDISGILKIGEARVSQLRNSAMSKLQLLAEEESNLIK